MKYFVILLFLMGFVIPVHAITDFTPPQNISNTTHDSTNPFVVADGKNIFLAWSENSKGNRAADILFSKSIDSGETFSVPKNISNQQGSSIVPFISIDGSNILVTWTYKYHDDQFSEIFFSKSDDGGDTFSIPQKLSNDTPFSFASKIATADSNIFITWFDDTNRDKTSRNMEIYFSKSSDGGKSFSPPQNLSNNAGFSASPSIATDGKNIFIVWQEDSEESKDIVFSKSIDGGDTFSVPKNISNSPNGSVGAKIATDGANIFVTWFEFHKGNADVFFSKSTDGGTTFSVPKNLSNDKEYSGIPFLLINGTDIFITWTDSFTEGSWINLIKSTDDGETFSAPKNISNEKGFSDAQSMSSDGKTIFVAWNHRLKMETPYDIIFTKSISDVSSENIPVKTNDDIMSKSHDIPVKISESDNNDAVISHKSVKWLNENGANYTVNGWGVLRLDNSELNVNKQLMDIPVVHVWSDTDPKGILIDVIETGPDTGIFYADLTLVNAPSSHLSLQVSSGDTVTVSFEDKQTDKLTDAIKITSKYLPPLKQFKSGISIYEIQCKSNFILMQKDSDSPACVNPDTKTKLIERGWADVDYEKKSNVLKNKTSEVTGAYELDGAICLGGPSMIKNDKCQRIGNYDLQTGIPIVENKVQCDMLNGTWYDKQNKCDSKYAPMEYRFQFGYSFLGYDVPQICTDDMMIHLARYSSMFENGAEYGIEDIGLPENINRNDYDICVDELLQLKSTGQ